jgi:MFS family permease
MMPSAMALLREAFPEPRRRARALGMWAMGGAVASSAGPVLGGLLDVIDWRLIFFINLPAGVVALALLARTRPSPRRAAAFDHAGQLSAVLAMGGLTYGTIEAGAVGFGDPRVAIGLAVAAAGPSLFLFGLAQRRGRHPMIPADLFTSRPVTASVVIGFSFMIGYYGLPFVFSLYLQQARGLSSLGTGLVFLPMMLIGLALTPFSARLGERFGRPALITTGLAAMTIGLVALALMPATTPPWTLGLLMILVGLGGPLVMPATMAALLDHAPHRHAGTASAVFNTSRQIGGALAVAVFGGLLADPDTFLAGVRTSLFIAAGIAALSRPQPCCSRTQPPAGHPSTTHTPARTLHDHLDHHELDRIGRAEELHITTTRPDGSLRTWVPIWVVRAGDDLIVRSTAARTEPGTATPPVFPTAASAPAASNATSR